MREPSSSSRAEAGVPIWCSRGEMALCLNMVGQSTKTFPSLPSSHPERGTLCGRWWVEGERTKSTFQHPSPIPGTNPPGRGRGRRLVVSLFLVEVTSGLWYFVRGVGTEEAAPVGAVAPAPCCRPLSVSMSPRCHFSPSGH